MKKIVPIFLLLLLLNGCARNGAAPAQTTPPQITPSPYTTASASPSQSPTANAISPTAKLLPKWHYDLTRDGVYRTDDNTGNVVKINNSDYPTGIIITEDWVYYRDDNSYLYRMDDENTKEMLVSEKCWPLHLNGDVLYYLSSSGLNRMHADGSGKESIFQCEYTGIEMTDTYIFYTLSTPESEEQNELPGAEDGPWYLGELHRVGLDGEGDVIVAELITNFSVYENLIYYANGEDRAFYSLNPETLEKTKIENAYMVEDSCLADGYLFFTTYSDRCFYKLSLQDGTLTWLSGGWPRCWGILDGYVYIDVFSGETEEDTGLFRIKTDDVELEKVSDWKT